MLDYIYMCVYIHNCMYVYKITYTSAYTHTHIHIQLPAWIFTLVPTLIISLFSWPLIHPPLSLSLLASRMVSTTSVPQFMGFPIDKRN